MGRPFKNMPIEMRDWDARADKAMLETRDMPDGPERDEAFRRIDQLRAAADMKRVLSRSNP